MANGPLTSPFAAQPSALEAPVPGQEQQIQQIDAAGQVPAGGEISPEIQQLLQKFQQAQEAPAVDPEIQALLEKFQASQEVAPGSGLEFVERAKLSFAQTDKEKRAFLESLPGVTEVEKKGDDFLVIREGKRQRVDPEQFEFFADVFGDLARPILETGVEAGAIAGGAALGGGLPGAFAAGAVGGAAATNVADFVQSELLGIERDPERSRLVETAFSATLGGVLNFVGAGVVGIAARRKIVKEIAEQNAAALGKIDRVGEQFRGALADLDEAGLKTTVEGADGKPIQILLSNLDVNTPEAKQLVKTLQSSDDFLRIQDDLAELHRENIDQILKSVGETQKLRDFDQIAATDVGIAQKTVNFVRKLKKEEGVKIGEFKARAAKTFKTAPGPVAKTDETLTEILGEFGIRREGDELLGLDPTSISEVVAIENPNLVKPVAKLLGDVSEALVRNKGGLSPSQLENFVKRVGTLNESRVISKEGTLKRAVAKLSSALRSDRIDVVELALPETLQGEFRASMQKFSKIARSTSEVSALLDGDELATDAFVNAIFKGGKDSLRSLRATKAIVQVEHPKLWKELTGEFFNKIIFEASEGGTERPTIKAIISKLNKFGPDFRKEILEGSPFSVKDLQSVLTLAKQFEKTNLEAASEETIDGLVRSFIKIWSPFTDARLNASRNIFNTFFGTPKVKKLLSQEGLDNFLEAGTIKERKFRKMIDNIFRTTTGTASRRTVRGAAFGAEAAAREEARR